MKCNPKCRNWGGLGVRGHSRSPAMSPFDRAHTTSYLTFIETMHLSCTFFRVIASYVKDANFNLHSYIDAPIRGDSIWISWRSFSSKN